MSNTENQPHDDQLTCENNHIGELKCDLKYNHKVDARKMPCPMPLLKMKQALNVAEEGEIVFVLATDPGSARDFKTFIAMTNHQMQMTKQLDEYCFWITKKNS